MNIRHWLKGKKIGVLYGGTSAERNISILSGKAVLKALKELKLRAVGIDVDSSLPFALKKNKIDFAYIALHGPMGEDGTVQGLLEVMGIPYSGCGVFASAVSMDKAYSKMIFDFAGIPTPQWRVLEGKNPRVSFPGFPVVVKPATQGSAIGVSIVENKAGMRSALRKAFSYDSKALLERYVRGTEITVAVLGNEALPAIEIVPANKFYDFESKYSKGKSRHLIPPRLPKKVLNDVRKIALKVSKTLGLKAVSRIDFIVDKKNKPWVLEVNTIPGMTKTSLLPDAAGAAGIDFNGLVLKIIEFSLDS
jgi:D-alanine-D-alanine ligase